MQRTSNTMLKAWPMFAAMVVLAGAVTLVLAQGSGTKPTGSGSKTKAPKDKIEVKAELNAEALEAIIGAKVPAVLLDARGPSNRWIANAVPIAHNADAKTIRRALANPDQLIITYCGGPKCPMSLMLANRLAELGYANVIRFTGGVEAWTKAGLALVKKDETKGSATRHRTGSSSKSSGSGTR